MTRIRFAFAFLGLIAFTGTSFRTISASLPVPEWHLAERQTFASDLSPPGSDTDNPGRPSVAFDGTNYLVVTTRMLNNSNTVVGVLVSRQGSHIREFGISEATPHYQASTPALAFGGTNYLVTFFSGGDIRGMRVSRDGSLLDGPDGFQISTGGNSGSRALPSVAWDGERFLVVWQKYGEGVEGESVIKQIRGAFVHRDGSVGPEIAIGPANFEKNEQAYASVAFGDGQYLVVWEDNRWAVQPSYESDLVGARVSVDGTVLDPEGIVVSRAPGNQMRPHIAFGGTNFFVVWQNDPDTTNQELQIFGTRVSRDGALVDSLAAPDGRPICTNSPAGAPRVEFDGERYVVTWTLDGYVSNNSKAGIYLARFDLDGNLIDGTDPKNAGVRVDVADPDCFACRSVYSDLGFDGSSYFVVSLLNREVSNGPLKEIMGKLVGRQGFLVPR
jgi:hypothetical protein